jgi:tol-pal system protein YbgF
MARKRTIRFVLVAVLLLTTAGSTSAANKEHQQMMAEIRMLQEQTALLRAQLAALNATLRTVTAKLDDQAGASRRAFADQKLLADTISSDLRVVREKVDDSNVRISSLSQELESVRMTIPQAVAAISASAGGTPPPDLPGEAGLAAPPAAGAPPPGVSPQKMYELAWGDYVGAQYNLAIAGFENYIRSYPRSEQAGDSQYFIGESYYQQGMFREAAAAFDRGISDYPNSKRVPDMYFKRGMAFSALGETARARESWEFVVKTFPNSDAGRLARQRLDQLIRKDSDEEDPPEEP